MHPRCDTRQPERRQHRRDDRRRRDLRHEPAAASALLAAQSVYRAVVAPATGWRRASYQSSPERAGAAFFGFGTGKNAAQRVARSASADQPLYSAGSSVSPLLRQLAPRPSPPDPSLATQLLKGSARDDDSHAAELLELVGAELRRLAAAYLRRERVGHTLQPTALVNEAYLKLIDSTVLVSGDRARFLGLAARAMRQVLIDFARKRKANRRGGKDWDRVSLHPDMVHDTGAKRDDYNLFDLDDALTRFAALHEKASQVVELRFFGGLTNEETGSVLGISDRMVRKYWTSARTWLGRELSAADPR
ncbi:MAG: RNA polymerase sigma-70 factor (ECF subfamily) [Pseudohongiellaceae bacterium]|jgi:RNA polymerase sigma-70 factor (ECF subfamily)